MAKERVIYNNYDLSEMYDDCRAYLEEEHEADEITEQMIWDEIYFTSEIDWEDEYYRLKKFFDGNGHYMLRGSVGRWDGTHGAGYVFDDFDDMFYHATKDCDYVKIWDEDGRFYLKCSHHDGTNIFEIKRISDRGYDIIENWKYNWNDKRTEEEIHDIIWNNNLFSSLLHYAHRVYGCKKREAA